MSDFKNGDNTGKAQPSSTCASHKARPSSVNHGKAVDGHADFMKGTNSGRAKPTSAGSK